MVWLAVVGMWLMEGSYVPQLMRLYRTKEAEDISLWFPLMNLTGRLSVMVYSFSQGQTALGGGFLFGIFLRGMFFGQVLFYRRLRRQFRQLEGQFAAAEQDQFVKVEALVEEKTLAEAGAFVDENAFVDTDGGGQAHERLEVVRLGGEVL